MKLEVTQENLNQALQAAGRIVGSRTTLPVLGNILIKTDKNRLKLSATNLELGINYWIGAKVEAAGAVTVPAKLLSDFVASLPSSNLKLSLDKTKLHIETDRHTSNFNGIEAEEFPSIPEVDTDPVLSVSGDKLKQAIQQVVLVASNDEARPVLNGVYVYTKGEQLYLVATDSYRLAEKKLDLGQELDDFEAIIPARTMQELLRLIGDQGEEVEVRLDENQLMFTVGGVELVSRVIDGKFPDYENLIPDGIETNCTLAVDEFINVAKVANLFARENAGSVNLNIDQEGKLEIESIATQVGDNKSSTEAEVEGESISIALNSGYLLDGLKALDSERVSFGVTGKVNPCLLNPIDDDSYLHIVMPLRS